MSNFYHTSYSTTGDGKWWYASYVIAPNQESANTFLQKRTLGEELKSKGSPYKLKSLLTKRIKPSDEYKAKAFLNCAHSLTFLSGVLVRAKLIDSWHDVLGDLGVLHQVIHHSNILYSPTNKKFEQKEVLRRIIWLENLAYDELGY